MDEQAKIKQCLKQYTNPELTRKDFVKVNKLYPGLSVMTGEWTFSTGMKRTLLKLQGTIPVPFRGKTYNIPICLWLMDTHPTHAPMCFVQPTSDMNLKQSTSLDATGRVYLPYLHTWNSNTSSIMELIRIMKEKFSESPPVYAKPKSELTSPKTPAYPPQPLMNCSPVTSSSVTPYPTSFNPVTPYPMYPSPQSKASTTAAPVTANFPYPSPQSNPSAAPVTANFPYTPPQPNASAAPVTANFPYPPFPAYPPTPATSTPSTNYPPYPSYPSTTPYPIQPMNNISTTTANTNGTITEEHIRASLMSAIEDKIRRKTNEQTALCRDEIEILLHTQRELNQGKAKLESMLENIEKESANVKQQIGMLKNKEDELEKAIAKLSVDEDDLDVDEAVITTTPLYKQILNTHCEDAATEDTIYYIGEALRKGAIDLDVFIKNVRDLSRKRFLMRSLLEKCRKKAGLAAI